MCKLRVIHSLYLWVIMKIRRNNPHGVVTVGLDSESVRMITVTRFVY